MDPITWLLSMCFAMFLGAYAAGLVPLSVSMSAARLRYITIFGAGLLVGTALIVIIPEGIAMHYDAQSKMLAEVVVAIPPGVVARPSSHRHLAHTSKDAHDGLVAALAGRSLLQAAESRGLAEEAAEAAAGALSPAAAAAVAGTETHTHTHTHTHTRRGEEAVVEAEEGTEETEEHTEHAHPPGHWQIGAALAFGFAFQLLVDRLSGGMHTHSHSAVLPTSAGTDDANVRANAGGDHSAKSKSAMVGMIVHACVDGVALGAAVREGDSALGMIVFLAIILHKAPSSFGLSSYLLHHGISYDGVRRRLLLFSLAAPTGAVLTYSLLSINLFSYKQEMLAMCLLFSGGTFLYVATSHVLPEIQHGSGAEDDDDETSAGHGHSHGRVRTPPTMKWSEVWTLVAGVLLPLCINVNHGH